jgi:ferrous iron transport protein A
MQVKRARRRDKSVDLDWHRHTLASLPVGSPAEIVALDPVAPGELLTRLRHLGFRAGAQVIKLRTAPLGDPAIYRLVGYDVCLRQHEAAYVEIAQPS